MGRGGYRSGAGRKRTLSDEEQKDLASTYHRFVVEHKRREIAEWALSTIDDTYRGWAVVDAIRLLYPNSKPRAAPFSLIMTLTDPYTDRFFADHRNTISYEHNFICEQVVVEAILYAERFEKKPYVTGFKDLIVKRTVEFYTSEAGNHVTRSQVEKAIRRFSTGDFDFGHWSSSHGQKRVNDNERT